MLNKFGKKYAYRLLYVLFQNANLVKYTALYYNITTTILLYFY